MVMGDEHRINPVKPRRIELGVGLGAKTAIQQPALVACVQLHAGRAFVPDAGEYSYTLHLVLVKRPWGGDGQAELRADIEFGAGFGQ
jgi:hypothetical protein